MYIVLVFFIFIVLRIHWYSWICGLLFLRKLGGLWLIFLQIFFCPTPSFPSGIAVTFWSHFLIQVTKALLFFFFVIFSSVCFIWLMTCLQVHWASLWLYQSSEFLNYIVYSSSRVSFCFFLVSVFPLKLPLYQLILYSHSLKGFF